MEPATITAAAIATLAFQKFVEAGAGELAKQFTQDAIQKMDDLRKLVWSKLISRDPDLRPTAQAIEQSHKVTSEQLEEITAHLQIAMRKEPQFAQQVQTIAHEITLMRIEDNSSMNQTNYGGTNYQVKTGVDNTNFFGGTHNHGR
ncbi:hypothetical protein [Egbenema bharatensis]|uniref:hypothetical protein n=1 Tax=Egbenema bharatensis TaxID=3463334 RepID=UPI003A8C6AF9